MDRPTLRVLLISAALVDVIFPLTVAVLDVIGGADPVRRTLSLHGLRPGVPWMAFAFLAHAFALELLAAGLRRLPPHPLAGPVALRLAGGAAALLAIFPADAPGQETPTGHLHESLALVAFLGIAVAGLFMANAQRRDPAWQGLWLSSAVLAFVLLGALAFLGLLVVVAQLYAPARGFYGVAERTSVALIGAWMVSIAVQGVRLTRRAAVPGVGLASTLR